MKLRHIFFVITLLVFFNTSDVFEKLLEKFNTEHNQVPNEPQNIQPIVFVLQENFSLVLPEKFKPKSKHKPPKQIGGTNAGSRKAIKKPP